MTFKDSNEAAFRRLVRDCIRRSHLTKSEQAVTLALANQWFHHKAKGVMHPGRDKIAKRARVSVRTVAHTMAVLRDCGALVVVSHPKGGRASTWYRLRALELMRFCGATFPDWMSGELVPFEPRICTLSDPEIARFTRAKIAHGLNDVGQCESETSKDGTGKPHKIGGASDV